VLIVAESIVKVKINAWLGGSGLLRNERALFLANTIKALLYAAWCCAKIMSFLGLFYSPAKCGKVIAFGPREGTAALLSC
jgi:hypothetical protein